MNTLVQFFVDTDALSPYPRWIFWVVLALIVVLTQVAKLPIKKLTDKITNETLRKKVNLVIMLIPFVLGFGASGILYACDYGFSATAAVLWGTTSQVIYEFVSKVVKRLKNNEDITNSTIKKDLTEAKNEAEDKFKQLVEQMKKGD